MPVDPATSVISEFGDEAREWWTDQTGDAPFGAQLPLDVDTSTATHLIRARRRGQTWTSVLALGRDGSIVAGSSIPAYEVGGGFEGPQRCFRLRWLVGLTWIVVAAAAAASIARFDAGGPFQFSLRLQDTRGAELGDLGDG